MNIIYNFSSSYPLIEPSAYHVTLLFLQYLFLQSHEHVPWIHIEGLDHSTLCYYKRLLLPLLDRTLTPLKNPSCASASPIRSKGIWTDQEGNMIMLLGIFNRKRYLDPGIEALSVGEIKIFLRSEDDFVCSTSSKCGVLPLFIFRTTGRQKVETTTIRVRCTLGNELK